MTSQAREALIYQGEMLSMGSEPLSSYLETLNKQVKFIPPTTACWRGYYGTWEVVEDELYLVELKAYLDGYLEVGIDYLFPGKSRVFAQWFTGTVVLQVGELLQYVHAGFYSVYEKDIFLSFEKGCLVKTSERINKLPKEVENKKIELLQPVKKLSWIRRKLIRAIVFLRLRKKKDDILLVDEENSEKFSEFLRDKFRD